MVRVLVGGNGSWRVGGQARYTRGGKIDGKQHCIKITWLVQHENISRWISETMATATLYYCGVFVINIIGIIYKRCEFNYRFFETL